MQAWYVLVPGVSGPSPSGPFQLAQLQAMAANGSLLPHSKVARVGAGGWTDAGQDPSLGAIFQRPAPQTQVAAVATAQPQVPTGSVDPARLGIAFAAGLSVAVASAAIWAAISYFTGYQIGYMAIGVGFAVGFAVGLTGQSTAPVFSLLGASLALGGCVLGNLWSACTFSAAEENVSALAVCLIVLLDPPLCIEILIETFSPLDILFYGLAIYEGYRFASRPAGS